MASSVIKLDGFRHAKQSQYMKRYRARLDAFIRSRIPMNWAGDMLRLADEFQRKCQDRKDMVWDYVELRELMLEFVTEQVARDIFTELEKQFWFDPRWVTLDSVSERCLSFMIIGESGAATGF
ncbi:MAG: hypothetical protein NT027_05780 [Proteobacteria bacterium]|nr:hypothetical protein [Pseudomonadota bacterium]